MSRSRKKVPAGGYCADTDKPYKVIVHRRARARNRTLMGREAYDLASFDDAGFRYNAWASCKDGKYRAFANRWRKTPGEFAELRKQLIRK